MEFRRYFFEQHFDALGFVAVGDKDGVFRFDDDEVGDAEEGDVFFATGINDVIGRVADGSGGVGAVVATVVGQVVGDRKPAADVVPIKGSLQDEDAPGFFQDGIIDGDFWQRGEFFFQKRLQLVGKDEAVDKIEKGWGIALEFGKDGGDGPDEHASVPTEVAGFEEAFGEVGCGFFAEAFHFVDGGRFSSDGRQAGALLDVAEAGAGPGWRDANGHECAGFPRGGDGDGEVVAKRLAVANNVIRREHDHGGGGVALSALGNEADSKGDGGGGVAFVWLGVDIFRGYRSDDASNGIDLIAIGEDEDVFHGNEAG